MADTTIFRHKVVTPFFRYDVLLKNNLTVETDGDFEIVNLNGVPISGEVKRYFRTIIWSWIFGMAYFCGLMICCQPTTDFDVFLEPCENIWFNTTTPLWAVDDFSKYMDEHSALKQEMDITRIHLRYNLTPDATTQLHEKLKTLYSFSEKRGSTMDLQRLIRYRCYKKNVQETIDKFPFSFIIGVTVILSLTYIQSFYFIDKIKEDARALYLICIVLTFVIIFVDIYAYCTTIIPIMDSYRYHPKFFKLIFKKRDPFFDF